MVCRSVGFILAVKSLTLCTLLKTRSHPRRHCCVFVYRGIPRGHCVESLYVARDVAYIDTIHYYGFDLLTYSLRDLPGLHWY